jgi:hypothetical protein
MMAHAAAGAHEWSAHELVWDPRRMVRAGAARRARRARQQERRRLVLFHATKELPRGSPRRGSCARPPRRRVGARACEAVCAAR